MMRTVIRGGREEDAAAAVLVTTTKTLVLPCSGAGSRERTVNSDLDWLCPCSSSHSLFRGLG